MQGLIELWKTQGVNNHIGGSSPHMALLPPHVVV